MHDDTRVKLDLNLNKKFNKQYNMNSIVRLEVEFLVTADFLKMRSDFNKVLNSAPALQEKQNGQSSKIELETCIMNFARPELLEGPNKWNCEKCNTKTEAVKYTYLSRDPEFLIIHLRRFKSEVG